MLITREQRHGRLMGWFERLIMKIGNWGTVLGAVFMSAIALLITATVIGRAVRVALPGTFDLVETLVVVGIAFALVYGQLQDRHLRAEIAIERLRGRVKSGIESFVGVLNLFYWAVLLYAGAAMFSDKWGKGEATELLKVPVAPFRAVWVFALIVMCLLLIFRLFHHLRRWVKGESAK
jgi:TRAP-type C4-dicarboxylate transport system permease small subunit